MSPRILIIEDDEILQDLLGMHLEIAGYAVATAPDGRVGLALLQEEGADVILLDLMMPAMDGVRFMAALAEMSASPPVIVLSAAGHGRREDQLKRAGARFVLRKPIAPDDLIVYVRAALDGTT